jgi:hypothetical protein
MIHRITSMTNDVNPDADQETYRRAGVRKRHQLRRDLLVIIAVPKSSFTSANADTPIRRSADTFPAGRPF